MSTWHQNRGTGLAEAYRPSLLWKVVIDPPNEPASVMEFSREDSAHGYAAKFKHAHVIPPRNPSNEVCDCGHFPTPVDSGGTGYSVNVVSGKKSCYLCSALRELHDMRNASEDERIPLYLDESSPRGAHVTNWTGLIRFKTISYARSSRGGGFGSPRVDVEFIGPDGFVWHGINRGDMQLCRVKRTKRRAL